MLTELLFAGLFPVAQLIALVVVGYLFRVDRKPKGDK